MREFQSYMEQWFWSVGINIPRRERWISSRSVSRDCGTNGVILFSHMRQMLSKWTVSASVGPLTDLFCLQYGPYTQATDRNGTMVYRGLCVEVMNAMASYLNLTYVAPVDSTKTHTDCNTETFLHQHSLFRSPNMPSQISRNYHLPFTDEPSDSKLRHSASMNFFGHFSYSVRFPYDLRWGSFLPDGSWNGLVNETITKVEFSKKTDIFFSISRRNCPKRQTKTVWTKIHIFFIWNKKKNLKCKCAFTFSLTKTKHGKIQFWLLLSSTNDPSRRSFFFQNADFVVAALSIQPRRREVMDFSFPFYEEYTGPLYKKPPALSKVDSK